MDRKIKRAYLLLSRPGRHGRNYAANAYHQWYRRRRHPNRRVYGLLKPGVSDIDNQYFTGTVPAKRQCVLNASADQQSPSLFVIEAQSIPAIHKRTRIETPVVLIKYKLPAV